MRASAFSRTGIESVGRFLAGLLLNLRGNQDLGQNVLTKKLGLVTEQAYGVAVLGVQVQELFSGENVPPLQSPAPGTG